MTLLSQLDSALATCSFEVNQKVPFPHRPIGTEPQQFQGDPAIRSQGEHRAAPLVEAAPSVGTATHCRRLLPLRVSFSFTFLLIYRLAPPLVERETVGEQRQPQDSRCFVPCKDGSFLPLLPQQ
jgi:hypothetical protein